LNASPDIRDQLRRLHTEVAPETIRQTPVEGVLVTDAEIDHTLGLILLREGRSLSVYATQAVRAILDRDSHMLPLIRAFGEVRVTDLVLDAPTPLCYRDGSSSGLSVQAFEVPAGPPRFASANDHGHTVGFMLRDTRTDVACGFVPGCGDLDEALLG